MGSKKRGPRAAGRLRPTAAELADPYELYERAVLPEPDAHRLIERIFGDLRGRAPVLLREDFCGTARLCRTWCQSAPERLSWDSALLRPHGWLFRLSRALGLGLLFSLLSAFNIGWRELNVGNWISRQPREYTLRATGWVRVVAGAQSLLGVYILALWVLAYFGRPFE